MNLQSKLRAAMRCAPAVILFAVLISFTSYAQPKLLRSTIKAGYGLRDTRDSNLVLLTDSIATREQIAPQISDSLNLIPRTSTVLPYDSLRRIGASPIAYFGHAEFAFPSDTAAIRLFGLDVAGGLGAGTTGAYMPYMAGHMLRSVVFDAIEITHSYDTTTMNRHRDTLVYLGGLDSLAAGTMISFSYHPASDGALNGTGAQIIRIYTIAQNATSGTYMDYKIKLPLIINAFGVHRGANGDHNIKVTLWVREKIPGRVY